MRAPRIFKETIWEKVGEFISQYPDAEKVPVDIEKIAAFDMGIEIIPSPELEGLDIEAYITRDFKSIVVMASHYYDDRYYNRVRFSIAHELGHLILHRQFFEAYNNGIDEWFEFMRKMPDPEYRFLENHANEFAGVLLVNADTLVELVDSGVPFNDLARRFQVSRQVINKRILNGDIEPRLRQD
jgi:Zn-dependent peptidase ImmA (M78 family)